MILSQNNRLWKYRNPLVHKFTLIFIHILTTFYNKIGKNTVVSTGGQISHWFPLHSQSNPRH